MATKRRLTSKPDDPEAARQYATWLLSGRPRTSYELREAMLSKGFDAEVIDEVLARFHDVGMIDDATFARMWVDSRHRVRGLSRRALAAELRRKGVEDEAVQAAVDEVTPESEWEAARAIAERRFRSMSHLSETVIMRRLVGTLGRKGYGPSVAIGVVKELLAEADSPLADEVDADQFIDPDQG
ncbi:regulatory protein RecX [Haloglycomyces albus]|uniref:regulatory protein RecX n=1 Tax=Haloglycomyces albus TaxID=526067 RepID=UPI00046D89A7|nr:regulatory protein RecX [Haloglycomyces albus]